MLAQILGLPGMLTQQRQMRRQLATSNSWCPMLPLWQALGRWQGCLLAGKPPLLQWGMAIPGKMQCQAAERLCCTRGIS